MPALGASSIMRSRLKRIDYKLGSTISCPGGKGGRPAKISLSARYKLTADLIVELIVIAIS